MSTVLITGGHSGLGWEVSQRLASEKGCDLVLAGRDLSKVEAAALQLRQRYGVQAMALSLNLASMESVRGAAANVRERIAAKTMQPLQALLCNAGAQFMGPVSYSVEGFEETFAVNYLGHFLLVQLLLDSMAEQSRVIFTASGTHDPDTMDGKVVGAAVEPDATSLAHQGKNGRKAMSGGKRYTTSKLCSMLFCYELDRRLKRAQQPVSSAAFDPGLIPETGLGRTAPGLAQKVSKTAAMKWLLKTIGVTMGSLSFSGASLTSIATDDKFAGSTGKYFQSKNGKLMEARSSRASYDEQKAATLWLDSERLVELKEDERPGRLQ